ncbi:LOW QUALITY PROTEIN: E3 ubiquitin-protein ligase RNF125-like [Pangshura tecta]
MAQSKRASSAIMAFHPLELPATKGNSKTTSPPGVSGGAASPPAPPRAMGSRFSCESRGTGTTTSRCALDLGTAAEQQQRVPSFDCSICLEVLHQPVRTQCGHVCPICHVIPGGDPSYFSKNFIRHLQCRHTFHHEDYIDLNIVEEVLTENVLHQSFLEYVQMNHPNST